MSNLSDFINGYKELVDKTGYSITPSAFGVSYITKLSTPYPYPLYIEAKVTTDPGEIKIEVIEK